MQTLYLVRHAIAEPRGDAWPDDSIRPLTKKGEARMREVANRLMAMGEMAEVIVTSPLKRAFDTASILADTWAPRPAVAVLEALAPGNTPARTVKALAGAATASTVALVGHEPDLGQLAAWLIGTPLPLPFKKGGVARIDVESVSQPRDGQLIWLATPKMLRTSE